MLYACSFNSRHLPGTKEDPLIGTRKKPHKDFDGEPGVAHAFHVEEGLVRVRLVLVQRPGDGVIGSSDRDVLD